MIWMVRRSLIVLLATLCVPLAVCLGLRINGAPESPTALGRVAISFHPGLHGRIELYAPLTDWGVAAHAFRAPAIIHIEPRALNRPALLELAGKPGPLLEKTKQDLTQAVWHSAWQALLWIGLIGLLLAAPVFLLARHWAVSGRWATLPPLGSILLSLLVGLVAYLSFNPSAFKDPTYWAKGSELPQLIDFAQHAHQASHSYESSVGHGIRELAGVLAGRAAGIKSNQSLVLASDLHNNLLALNSVRGLIDHYPLVFAGDFAHGGTPAEQNLLLPALRNLGHPLLAVSGNHDSRQLMTRIAGIGGVVLGTKGQLTGNDTWAGNPIYTLHGLKIMGLQDPLEAQGKDPNRSYSLTPGQKAAVFRSWLTQIQSYRPNVVIIHQVSLARKLAQSLKDQPLTLLAGHDHKQSVERYGKAVVVDAGTVGAGGIFGAGRQYVGLAKLYFEKAQLQAVDMVRLEPLRGDGQSQRIVIDDQCKMLDQTRCSYTLQPLPDHP